MYTSNFGGTTEFCCPEFFQTGRSDEPNRTFSAILELLLQLPTVPGGYLGDDGDALRDQLSSLSFFQSG